MSAARYLSLAVACALASGWSGPAESARKKAEPTLGSLAGRAAPVDRSLPVQAAPDDAANSYEAFLQIDGADPALKAQALRRLGDLRLEQAAMLSAVGDVPDPASQAKARDAVAAYQELLRDYPDYAARDAALYQLARASEVAGDADAAMAALDELVLRHPQGAHADEAQFRRGEVFFSAQRYAEAEQAYAAVLAMGPASAFHEQALYKRGWAQFKLGDNAASSRDFLALLDTVLVQDGELRDVSQLTRPQLELSDDALRALSLMFAADEGAASLQAALSSVVLRRTSRGCTARSATCTSKRNATRTAPKSTGRSRVANRSILPRRSCSARRPRLMARRASMPSCSNRSRNWSNCTARAAPTGRSEARPSIRA